MAKKSYCCLGNHFSNKGVDVTKKQEEAIADLEAAFRKCNKYNLTFNGMGDELLCVSNKAILEYSWEKLATDFEFGQVADTYKHFQHDPSKTRVIKAKSYIDSGGW